MPIYDYMCRQCGKISEILDRTIGGSEVHCPECGGDKMEKLISSSYMIKTNSSGPVGSTCCGKEERCDSPPCSAGGSCRRDH